MHDLQPLDIINPADPLIAEGDVADLWSVFLRAVHDPRLLDAGGHWLWGVSTFEHDPSGLPFPWVLPVLSDGRVWPRDFDAGSDPLTEDPSLRERWLEVAEGLRRCQGAGRLQHNDSAPLELPARERSVACRHFGTFDAAGFETLVRIRALLTLKLALPGALFCLGVRPGTENLETVLVKHALFDRHARIDFRRGALDLPILEGRQRWKRLFVDIQITDQKGVRPEMVRLLRADRLPRSQRPAPSEARGRSWLQERARERRLTRRVDEERRTEFAPSNGTKKNAVRDAVRELERQRPDLFQGDKKLEPHDLEQLLRWDVPPLKGHNIPTETRRSYLRAELQARYERPQSDEGAK